MRIQKNNSLFEGIVIGEVPVKIFQKYIIIRPKFYNYFCIEEVTNEYIMTKKFKNKFVLAEDFYDYDYNSFFYRDLFQETPLIISTTKVFNNINILNLEYDDNYECLLEHELILKLKEYYDFNKLKQILKDIIIMSREEFKKHDNFEDYDFCECISIVSNNFIEKYFDDVDNNLENIYILQSLLYPGFLELYYELFCITKK